MMTSLAISACGGRSSSPTAPIDPFAAIAVGQLPVGTLGGTNVLLLAVGGVVVGDSAQQLPDLETRRSALLGLANTLLDSALRRDGREVNWMGLDEQRRAARRNPTLGLEPDRFATSYLIDANMDKVPDPLFAALRSLAALTNARFAVVPAGVRITGTAGAYTASYILVVADARTGNIMLRIRTTGHPAATADAAMASAAAMAVFSPLH
jgi:hypothetical protein